MIIPIVFGTDDNYLLPLSVAIQSLKNHKSKNVELRIYIFYEKLSKDTMELLFLLQDASCKIEFVDVSSFFDNETFYSMGYFTHAMYYRLAIPLILPQYDKIIYLDCDTLCLNCISNLYNTDLKENYVAGVHDVLFKDASYINSGVLVFNSKEYVKNSVFENCVKFIKKNQDLEYPDQDAINFACKDKTLLLLPQFNYLSITVLNCCNHITEQKISRVKDIAIVHFVTQQKPWLFKNFPFANLWWKETKKLPKVLKKELNNKYLSKIDKRKFNYNFYKYYFGSKIYKLWVKTTIKIKGIFQKKR